MQLKIKSGTSIKDYTLTSAYAKPYVNIANSSVLPLTTNTISGMQLKFKIGNQTYRALEYKGTSSASYLTTADEARKLTNATALTRVSTSDTKYSTRVSTSDTKYLTRVSTSGTSYLTSAGTQTLLTVSIMSYRWGTFQPTGYVQYYSSTVIGTITKEYDSSLRTYFLPYGGSFTNTGGYWYDGAYHISGSLRPAGSGTFNISMSNRYFGGSTVSNSWTSNFEYNGYLQSGTRIYTFNNPQLTYLNSIANDYYNSLQTMNSMQFTISNRWETAYTDGTEGQQYSATATRNIVTTSTQYLTRASTYSTEYKTRASTYSTDYKTRVSTSGWTGQSSSSYWLSTSATYLTTRNYSEGLSSTTALTCESTSSIDYLTRVSTSSIDYLTRVSTSSIDYLTRVSTSGTSPLTAPGNLILESLILSTTSSGHGVWGWDATYGESLWKYTNASYSRWFTLKTEWETDDQHYLTQDGYYSSYNNWIGTASYTMQHRNNLTTSSCDQYSGVTYYDTDTYRRSIRTTSGINANISSSTTGAYYSNYFYDVRNSNTYDTDYYRWARGTAQTGYCETFFNWRSSSYDPSAYSKYHAVTGVPNFQMIQEITGDWYDGGLYAAANYSREYRRTTIRFYRGTKTTGTSYLTRVSTYDTKYYTCASTSSTRYYTCVSTSATNYYTRSSTSGYSGVSSSSDVAHGEWV